MLCVPELRRGGGCWAAINYVFPLTGKENVRSVTQVHQRENNLKFMLYICPHNQKKEQQLLRHKV